MVRASEKRKNDNGHRPQIDSFPTLHLMNCQPFDIILDDFNQQKQQQQVVLRFELDTYVMLGDNDTTLSIFSFLGISNIIINLVALYHQRQTDHQPANV
jgi:hypothetical protein